MSNNDERNVDPIQEMNSLVQTFLNLDTWGFKESFRSVKNEVLIYDSQWCRISITWGGWDYLGGNSVSIHYGRLHAPNESAKMNWNGEECHAWHRFEHALHFLDGRSPADAAKMNYSTPFINKYYEEEYLNKFPRRQPEWLMKMHTDVWSYYGTKLFELFDLRQSKLWEQYRIFLKDFYDIKGRIPAIKPSLDKVC